MSERYWHVLWQHEVDSFMRAVLYVTKIAAGQGLCYVSWNLPASPFQIDVL
jgi:hypothetical protein